jgi:hypothetical protein
VLNGGRVLEAFIQTEDGARQVGWFRHIRLGY